MEPNATRGADVATPRLPALTGLRFFAALWVVLYHYAPFREDVPLVAHGYLAVPLFLVLSGFVLAYSRAQARRDSSAATFWLGRLTRLYPTYLLGLALATALALTVSSVRIDSAMAEAVLLQAWLPGSAPWLNGPGWSLSVEMALYVIFPLLAARLQQLSDASLVRLAVVAWLAASAVAAVLLVWVLAGAFEGADRLLLFWPPLHAGSFVMGASAGTLVARRSSLSTWAGTPQVVVAVVLILAAMASPIPGAVLHDGLLSPVFVLLLIGLAHGGPLARLLGSRPVVALGDASYALYVLQAPLWGWWLQLGLGDALGFWPGCAMLVAGSVLVHRGFERPARGWLALQLRRPASRRRLSCHVGADARCPQPGG